jgi:hypothetical protein
MARQFSAAADWVAPGIEREARFSAQESLPPRGGVGESRRGANAASRKCGSASDRGRVKATPSRATFSRRRSGQVAVAPTSSTGACSLAGANPRRRTSSRPWLALCEPPTAEAFALRLGLSAPPTGTSALAPHRIGLRHSARPLRLPLKGGVMLEFLERRWGEIEGRDDLRGVTEALLGATVITPPLRGSRREGEARLRAGGGPTRRPVRVCTAKSKRGVGRSDC